MDGLPVEKNIYYIYKYTPSHAWQKVAAKHFPEHDSETSESPLINFEGKNPCQVAQGHNRQHLLAAAVALLSWFLDDKKWNLPNFSFHHGQWSFPVIPSSEEVCFFIFPHLSSKNHLAKMIGNAWDIEGAEKTEQFGMRDIQIAIPSLKLK